MLKYLMWICLFGMKKEEGALNYDVALPPILKRKWRKHGVREPFLGGMHCFHIGCRGHILHGIERRTALSRTCLCSVEKSSYGDYCVKVFHRVCCMYTCMWMEERKDKGLLYLGLNIHNKREPMLFFVFVGNLRFWLFTNHISKLPHVNVKLSKRTTDLIEKPQCVQLLYMCWMTETSFESSVWIHPGIKWECNEKPPEPTGSHLTI